MERISRNASNGAAFGCFFCFSSAERQAGIFFPLRPPFRGGLGERKTPSPPPGLGAVR